MIDPFHLKQRLSVTCMYLFILVVMFWDDLPSFSARADGRREHQ